MAVYGRIWPYVVRITTGIEDNASAADTRLKIMKAPFLTVPPTGSGADRLSPKDVRRPGAQGGRSYGWV